MRLKVSELALLKIMHSRIGPNTMGMDYYARAFSALLRIERANLRDLCKLTELDSQSVSHLVKNLEKTGIILPLEGKPGEFVINLETEKLFEMIEKQEKELKWITVKKTEKKTSHQLACTIAAPS
jgi:sugar-specific transcriptional regulator TrmB